MNDRKTNEIHIYIHHVYVIYLQGQGHLASGN